MNVQVNEQYRITSDTMNIVVEEIKVRKSGKSEGEEYSEPIAFFPTFKQAVEWLIERNIKTSEAETLEQLADDMEYFKIRIKLAIRQLEAQL